MDRGGEEQGGRRNGLPQRIVGYLKGSVGITAALLALIWGGLSLVPEESGVAFGLIYQLFFSVILLIGAGFFWLLRQDRLPQPRSSLGVMGSVVLVYLVTVGILVGAGIIFPQFEGASAAVETPVDGTTNTVTGGETLFWSSNPGCFLCHSIDDRPGGTRGPDLTEVASRAADRVEGLTAEQYIRESIMNPSTFVVEPYDDIMPPNFGTRFSVEDIDGLVEYLLGPR